MKETRGTDGRFDYRNTYAVRLIIGALALAAFFTLHYLYTTGMSAEFDSEFAEAVRSVRIPALNVFMICITYMGQWTTLAGLAAVLLIVNSVKWHKVDFLYSAGAGVIDLAIYRTLKAVVGRPRPDEAYRIISEHGFSFPSGHSMNSLFCYGIMLYLLYRNCGNEKIRKILTVSVCVLVPLIGFSRIYVGVHYPTDVLAGFSMGLAVLMLSTVLIDEILLRKNQDPPVKDE